MKHLSFKLKTYYGYLRRLFFAYVMRRKLPVVSLELKIDDEITFDDKLG
jgi:hypothetical protein